MKKLLLLLTVLLLSFYLGTIIQAQSPITEKCGSDILHDRMLQSNPVYKQNFEDIARRAKTMMANTRGNAGRAPILTIPVVVHVMHLGEAVGVGNNISYEQILSAIESMNNAYRNRAPYTGVDMEIEFCLASRDPLGNPTDGVNRINASGTSTYATNGMVVTGGGNNEIAIKNLSRWSNNDYYNIWTVSEIDNNNGGAGIQGFAYFPGVPSNVDGTVILANVFGYDPGNTRCLNLKGTSLHNATLIHEMGHAFGLFHTFRGDANGTACPANGNCNVDGDEICDTPPHERTNSTCPTGTTNLCGTARNAHIHNFMEYSSDPCLTEFTAGQKTRARAFINSGRPGLLISQACNPPNAPTSDFVSECTNTKVSRCLGTGTTINFYDLSTQNPNGWTWTFTGGTPSSSTAQNPTITYNTPGIYPVTLQASNGVGSGNTETKSGYVNIFAPPVAASCINTIANPGNAGHSISNVSFGDINNTTPTTSNGYDDFTCTATTCVTEGQTYTLSLNLQAANPSQGAGYRVYIDYNNNGDLSDVGEEIANGTIAANSGIVTRTHNITLPTNATENLLLRMRVVHDQVSVSSPCENLFTGSAEDYGVYIATAAAITTPPANQSTCAGGSATFTIASTGGNAFQWQENTGSGFVNIINSGVYSGANTNTLLLTGVTNPMNGNIYRCIVGNGCDQTVTSTNATLSITGGSAITTQPTNQADCAGSTINFIVAATGSPAFQWQENTGSGFTNITNGGIYSGATSANLTLTGVSNPMNGNTYRCVVGTTPCDVNSNNATLTVNAGATITTQPTNQADCAGSTINFIVAATGSPAFQWQENTGSGFTNITNGGIYSGATSANLTLTGVSNPMNGNTYRCVVGTTPCDVNSNNATLTVNAGATITTQPTNQTDCAGSTINFTITATGSPAFQWQENTGSGFTNITNGGIYSGATSANLTLTGVSNPMNGNTYRCVVGTTPCDVNSNNATLTVNAGSAITTQPTNQTDCAGSTINFIVAATGSPAFQWQENTGSGFTNITNGGIYSGATSANLILTGVSNPMNGNTYRCVVGTTPCDVNSNNATLTVSSGINITTNLPDTTRSCEGINFSLTVAATGANGFQWFEFDGTTWTSLTNGGIYSGVTTNTLTFTNPTGIHNYQYYCNITHPTCSNVSSDTTININLLFNTQPTSQAAIAGNTINLTATHLHATCGTIWEVNSGSGWITLTPNTTVYPNGINQNTLDIVMDASLDGNWYRKAACGVGCTVFSDSAEISLIQASLVRDNMYQFDGIDDHIIIESGPLGNSNTQDISYTFEAWVNPTNATALQAIIGNHNYDGTLGTALDLTGGNARFIKGEGTDIVSGAIIDGEWSHLAGTYDASTDEMRLYINGFLMGTTTSTTTDGGGIHHIGSHSGQASIPLANFFDGSIDEVRIWNTVRTQTEIRENMHLSLSPTATGLMAYYQFDRDKSVGIPNGVRDAVGLHHATAQLAASALVPSEVHVGGGSSNTQNILTTGNVIFTGTDLEIDFTGVAPLDEVVVTHIRSENAFSPPINAPLETGYWIINNYGNNVGLNATTRFNYSTGLVTSTLLTDYTLYKRPSRATGAWPQLITPASTASIAAGNNHVNFTGLNSFSNLVPTQTNTLLFNNFLSFEATPTNQQTILLNWELENEKEVDFYEVEKSVDGVNWEKIGHVSTKNTTNSYQLEDLTPINGYNYYRIKQVYLNQQVFYSWTRVVELIQEQGLWIYPNPNQGIFTIDFEHKGTYQIEVFDAIGQRIFQTEFSGNKNIIDLDTQATGIYTIKVSTNNNSYYSRLVIEP